MKLIIDIPEERFKDIQRIASVQIDSNHFKTAEQIISNGIPYEERPTGHWEKTGTKIYHCSHCGCVDSIGFANFCWLCGADMRERETQPSTEKVEKTLTEAFFEDINTDDVNYNELCYQTGHHLTMCDCELCDHRHECSGYEGDDDEVE